MHRITVFAMAALVVGALARGTGAQQLLETFPVVGTPIPGWTHYVSPWTVKDVGGGDTRAESGPAGHTYLVRTNSPAVIGAVHATATGVTATCNGGVLFRFDSSITNGIRAYGASSGGQNAYAVLMIEAPGVGRQFVSLLPNRTKNLVCRLLVQGTEARGQFDIDPPDGKWDYELGLTGVPTTGTDWGVYAWNTSWLDDVKFFDAVIFRRSTFGQPNLGTTVPLDLYAPTANAPYLLIPSLTSGMVRLPNGWFGPIIPDALSGAAPHLPAIFQGFTGHLDGTGKATARLAIPNAPALAGITVWLGGVVLDGRPSPSLLHLFNDERIDLW
ncbi:MAG: hypothetical protein JXQ29_09300 [Planctomycetes bacterium]|nr:hypothetical protein [Planctomycetota bacterium]